MWKITRQLIKKYTGVFIAIITIFLVLLVSILLAEKNADHEILQIFLKQYIMDLLPLPQLAMAISLRLH
ncbi:MAG TPA: hypothetical protein PLM49_02725 [Bacteroidales bacterium]|nr:hypothetical protein [Bacteroidales bacterium]